MNPAAAEELRRIIEALYHGQATAEQQQMAAGFLQPAWVVMSQLPEHLLQSLMFTEPKDIELINLVVLTSKGVQSMNDEPAEEIPS